MRSARRWPPLPRPAPRPGPPAPEIRRTTRAPASRPSNHRPPRPSGRCPGGRRGGPRRPPGRGWSGAGTATPTARRRAQATTARWSPGSRRARWGRPRTTGRCRWRRPGRSAGPTSRASGGRGPPDRRRGCRRSGRAGPGRRWTATRPGSPTSRRRRSPRAGVAPHSRSRPPVRAASAGRTCDGPGRHRAARSSAGESSVTPPWRRRTRARGRPGCPRPTRCRCTGGPGRG